MPPCPDEIISQHPDSPGIVADKECICRGAFGPSPSIHYKADGSVKGSFVRGGDLLKGTLSVWRSTDGEYITHDDLAGIMNDNKPDDKVQCWVIYGCPAKEIREQSVLEIGTNVFCIVDNCEIDDVGNTHPAHAEIHVREEFEQYLTGPDTLDFLKIKNALATILLSNVHWNAA